MSITSFLLDPWFVASFAFATFNAGLSKGGFGSGASFAAVPLLALVVPAPMAIALMLPVLCAMDLFGLAAYWRKWSWPHARAMMIACLPGILIGTLTFSIIPAGGLKVMLGLLSLVFVFHQIYKFYRHRQPVPPKMPNWFRASIWGPMAGFTSFALHAGGPPNNFYLLPLGFHRTTYQATTVLIFWWMNLVKIAPYLYLGLFPAEYLTLSLIFLPLAPVAFFIGVWAHKNMTDRLYFLIVYGLLILTGFKLLYDGFSPW